MYVCTCNFEMGVPSITVMIQHSQQNVAVIYQSGCRLSVYKMWLSSMSICLQNVAVVYQSKKCGCRLSV